jgi:hypothetical protein
VDVKILRSVVALLGLALLAGCGGTAHQRPSSAGPEAATDDYVLSVNRLVPEFDGFDGIELKAFQSSVGERMPPTLLALLNEELGRRASRAKLIAGDGKRVTVEGNVTGYIVDREYEETKIDIHVSLHDADTLEALGSFRVESLVVGDNGGERVVRAAAEGVKAFLVERFSRPKTS